MIQYGIHMLYTYTYTLAVYTCTCNHTQLLLVVHMHTLSHTPILTIVFVYICCVGEDLEPQEPRDEYNEGDGGGGMEDAD